MAAKVNIKFIGILFVSVTIAVGLIGGLWILQYRSDATRNVVAGDEFMAAGDFRMAKDMYGRAVFKDQTNREYMRKYEKALLSIQPESRDDARELYESWLAVLGSEVTYRGMEYASHKRLIEELMLRATLLDNDQDWRAVDQAAVGMWDKMPVGDPDRILAKQYRGVAAAHRVSVLTDDEIERAEADLREVLEARPDADPAWAALIALQVRVADMHRAQGRTSQFQDALDKLAATQQEAKAAAPNGIETAIASARALAYRRLISPEKISDDEIKDAINKVAMLAETEEDRLILMHYVQLMREMDYEVSLLPAVERLRSVIKDDKQAIFERLSIATAYLVLNKLDEAYQYATSVIEAPPLNVGLLSTAQFDLRREASRINVDVEVRRWEAASAEDRPKQFERVMAARELLNKFATSQEDLLLLWADGRIALIKGDYETAAAKLERYIEGQKNLDPQTVLLSSKALEEIGQVGLAYQRVRSVSDAFPNNVQLLIMRARLEFNIGRRPEAQATLARAEKLAPGHEGVAQLRTAMEERTTGTQAELTQDDKVNQKIAQARDALAANDTESARDILRSAHEMAPNEVNVLKFWFNVEIGAGNLEEARRLATMARELAPDDKDLMRVQSLLDHEDPVEAVKQFAAMANQDPGSKAVAEVINLRALAVQQRNIANTKQAQGDAEEAAKAIANAERAEAEADRLLPEAERIAPNDRTLIEHQFVRQTLARNWSEAAKIVQRAAAADADRVGGAMYRGRLALAQAKYQDAVTHLDEATKKMGFSSYAWRLLGMAYEGAGNVVDAQRAYQRSYECNPNDLATLRIYTTLLVRIGDATRAIAVLRNATSLLPDTSAAVEYWLSLEAEHGDIGRVLKRRREMYARSKDNITNALQLALLLGQVKPKRELIVDSAGNPTYASNRWDRLRAEEQKKIIDDEHNAWLNESEAILKDVESKGVRGLAVVNVRARNALARDHAEQGEQILRSFIDEQKAAGTLDLNMMLTFGQYLAEARRFEQARDVFVEARELQDPVRRQADLVLGDFYFRGGRFEQAGEAYATVLEGGENPSTRQRLVECYIKTRKFDEAAECLSKLKEGSSDYVNAMLEAAIAEGRGQDLFAADKKDEAAKAFEQQTKALERAMTLAPSQPMPHVQRAIAYLNEFKRTGEARVLDSALNSLDAAARLQSDFAPISIARADVLLAQGKLDMATGELGRLLKITPESIPVRRRLIELYLEAGRTTEAATMLREATTLFPEAAIWAERYADLQVALGDINAAEPYYLKAYTIDPNRQLLAKLAVTRLRMTPANPRATMELLAAREAEVNADPALRGLFAEGLFGVGKQMEALEQMRLAYRQYRQMLNDGEINIALLSQWYMQLRKVFRADQMADAERFIRQVAGDNVDYIDLQWIARFWSDSKEGLPRAIEIQLQAIEKCPKDSGDLRAGLFNDLSLYYLRSGQVAKAIEVMEQLIVEQPKNATALNNLAYLIGSQGAELSKAVGYAERALEIQPRDPNIMDTLGYVLMLNDENARAETLLRDSIDISPLASTYLHLGQLYLKTAQPRYKIENALRRAEELNPDAQTREEIKRLLDDMRKTP